MLCPSLSLRMYNQPFMEYVRGERGSNNVSIGQISAAAGYVKIRMAIECFGQSSWPVGWLVSIIG